MATNVTTVITCDLEDGKGKARPGEPVSFGIDGTALELDLCPKHRTALEEAFAPYVEHGRRVRPGSGQARQSQRARADQAPPPVQAAAVRAWAAASGITVSPKGRIAAGLVERFEAEQQGTK